MAKKPKEVKEIVVEVVPIEVAYLKAHLIGTGALFEDDEGGMIMHRFSWKAWTELLFPSPPKNRAERADKLKHDPLQEYRECFYKNRDPKTPSMFHLPNGMIGKAIAAAALDTPESSSKAEISRWVQVVGQINLFGIPTLRMDMVRQGGISRTPDVRTRPYFTQWACEINIRYVKPMLNEVKVANLLASAGVIVGVGDWRPQKGGTCGTFEVVLANDPRYLAIVKNQGRAAQQAAFDNPSFHDDNTADLYRWFYDELERRGREAPSSDDDDESYELEQAPTDDAFAEAAAARRGRGNGRRVSE
jgi:hypothetical protein